VTKTRRSARTASFRFLSLGSTLLAVVTASVALLGAARPTSAAPAAPWLFVSDVHLDPNARDARPASFGADTNPALLRSALAAMRAVDPNPPVVVIGGDFLAHNIRPRDAARTEVLLAREFDRAFPQAQFVVTLGNEDSDCGDYRLAPRSAFLQTFARAWGPLVNRHGAAPDFAERFPRDGFYVARLPLPGLRAVVVDDVLWSPRFRPCGGARDDGAHVLETLRATLRPGGKRTWVLFHIPPGIDAFSTIRLAQGLVVVPLLEPGPRTRLVALLDDPARNVALVVTGHVHRFAFRLLGATTAAPAPLLGIPAISPIYGNTPSFLTATVRTDGTIAAADEHALVAGRWRDLGGTRDLGLDDVTAPSLARLQERLARSARLRTMWSRLYDGDARPEITERTWRGYWCVTTALSATDYRACTDTGGIGIFTTRGIVVGSLVLLALIGAAAVALIRATRLARRRVR
jgi:sphingomyelin phosphodiesterase acid-like 3